MTVLPDKPSALIRLAIADMKSCAEDSDYELNMNQWHLPSYRGSLSEGNAVDVCKVCMAGAVMAKSLKVNSSREATPRYFGESDTRKKLSALDNFRCGELRSGVRRMCTEAECELLPQGMYYKFVNNFHTGPTAFYNTMNGFADNFETVGL